MKSVDEERKKERKKERWPGYNVSLREGEESSARRD
jgi:hypothetical protein